MTGASYTDIISKGSIKLTINKYWIVWRQLKRDNVKFTTFTAGFGSSSGQRFLALTSLWRQAASSGQEAVKVCLDDRVEQQLFESNQNITELRSTSSNLKTNCSLLNLTRQIQSAIQGDSRNCSKRVLTESFTFHSLRCRIFNFSPFFSSSSSLFNWLGIAGNLSRHGIIFISWFASSEIWIQINNFSRFFQQKANVIYTRNWVQRFVKDRRAKI